MFLTRLKEGNTIFIEVRHLKKIHIILLVILIAVIAFLITDTLNIVFDTNHLKHNVNLNIDSSRETDNESYVKNYQDYVASNPQVFPSGKVINVPATDFIEIEGDYDILYNFHNVSESVLTEEVGTISLPVEIEEAGFY